MRCGVVCGLVVAVFAAGIGHANPYDGRLLSLKDLKAEAKQNDALDAYLVRNGLPDVAEAKALSDRPPWDDHEVTLYYLGTRKEISFARATILSKTNVAITRYERDLSDADVAALMGVLETATIEIDRDRPGETEAAVETVAYVDTSDVAPLDEMPADEVLGLDASDPASRAEAAAMRAEEAADRVEVAADKAEGAALRAEKAFDRLAAAFESKRTR